MASKDASDAPGWGERGTSTVSFSSTAGLLGTAGLPGDDQRALQEGIYSKMNKRIVPMFMAVMVLNNIDRTNLAFAATSFNRDLGFDPITYGVGSSLFFVTFCIFQVPANLVMLRVGVSRWLAVLIAGWGTVASCFALVRGKPSFYLLRLLLGVFEAGAVPAMWFHLSQFYPKERLTKPYTYLTLGVLLAQIISGPLAAGFLAMDGLGGLHGWQWLFMLEGVPSVLLGVVVFFLLPDHPRHARWLSAQEKALLADDMADSLKDSPPAERVSRNPFKLLRKTVANPLVTYICFAGILLGMASHTYVFWLPTIIEALLTGKALHKPAGGAGGAKIRSGKTSLLPAILTSAPYLAGALTSWLVAHNSQKRRELYLHVAACLLGASVFFFLFPVFTQLSLAAGFVSLVLVAAFGAASTGPKSALAARLCAGEAQAVAMPFYNSVSVIGGIIGPSVTGAIVAKHGGFTYVSIVMGSVLCIASLMVAALRFLVPAYERRTAAAAPAAGAAGPHGGWHDADDGNLPVTRKSSGTQAAMPTQVLVQSEHAAPAVHRAANGRGNAAAGSL